MNPNGGEPVNPSGVVAAPVMDAPKPPVGPDPLQGLQSVVDAAKQAAMKPSEQQFVDQFAQKEPTQPVQPAGFGNEPVQEQVTSNKQQEEPAAPKEEVVLPPKVQEFLDAVLSAADKYKSPEEEQAT